jgi:hypothetical protein
VQLLYSCCKSNIFLFINLMLGKYHSLNLGIAHPHMRVGSSVWDSPSCEGLLCSCCIGVVNLTFSFL